MNREAVATVGAATRQDRSTAHYLHCARPVAGNALRPVTTVMRLEEESEFYVPDLLSDDDFEIAPDLFDAADEHATVLREAERYIDEALHLADVLRAAMGDAGDSRAMQVDTVLAIVRERLTSAQARIDEHDTSHLNLFMAYAELKKQSTGG